VTEPAARVEGGVLHITLPGTPFDSALATALHRLLPARDDLSAAPVILLSAPPQGEFAGLGAPAANAGLPDGIRDGGPDSAVARCIEALASLESITIASLSGDARGCGAELALACDLRVAARSARLGFPHVASGRVPAAGATQRLPRLVGPGPAFRALVLGEEIDGDEMARLGLAVRATPTAQAAVEEAQALAARLSEQPATALRACKEAMNAGIDLTLRDGLRLEADLAVLLQTTHDRAEGIRAFLEKRPPRFRGE
jgi:enoyl-CoA hydratase/carnithine racemase